MPHADETRSAALRKRDQLRKLRRDRRTAFVMGLDVLVRKLDADIARAEASVADGYGTTLPCPEIRPSSGEDAQAPEGTAT